MVYLSQRYAGEIHINEAEAQRIESEAASYPFARGYVPRDFSAKPVGCLSYAKPFNLPLIPRSEWPARIEEMERTGTNLSSVAKRAGVKALNQSRTNFCWANAPVQAVQVARAWQNESLVLLSPASVAYPIKRANVGGWGLEAVEYIAENGIAPVSYWGANELSMRGDTPECREARKQFKITEWLDLTPGNFDQLATCLLNRIPCPIGLNWWRHEVLAMDLLHFGNMAFGIRILNSWDVTWSAEGYGTLEERRGTPDDSQGVMQATAGGASRRESHFATAA